MRKSLLTLAAFALALTVNAQSSFKALPFSGQLEKANAAAVKTPQAFKAPKKVDLASNQRLAGLYTSDTYASSEKGLGLASYPGSLGVFSYWPTSVLSKFEGKELKSIRYALANSAAVTAVTIYGVGSDGYVHEVVNQAVTTSSSPAGWSTVDLTTPWTISTGDYTAFLVGFTYTQTSTQTVASFPLSMVNEGDVQNVYVYGNLGQGEGFYSLGSEYGNLSVQGIVEGDFPTTDLSLVGLSTNNYYKKGETGQYDLVVNNFGAVNAKYEINVTLDGQSIGTLANNNGLDVQKNDTLHGTFTLPADAATGNHELKAAVATINGEVPTEMTADDTLSTSFLAYKDDVARQRQLIEHYTSNTCTYCYLGDELLDQLTADNNDYAWVSIHGNQSAKDPYNIEQGDTLINLFGLNAFPSAGFNRQAIPDLGSTSGIGINPIGFQEAYISQIVPVVDELVKAQAGPSFVTLNLNPTYTDRKLTVKVTGTGVEDASKLLDGDGLYIYLAEDSIKYRQYTNGRWINDDNHNQVFRGALGSVLGNDITWNGDNFEATYTYDIPAEWVLSNVKVVAFVAHKLDDTATEANIPVNQAEQAYIKDATGISSITTGNNVENSQVVARYNAAGQRIATAQPGLNILKLANGKTVKVIVK